MDNAAINDTITGVTGNLTINFPSVGQYRVEIAGDFPWMYLRNDENSKKILSIEQWGNIVWTSMEDAFTGAVDLQGNASDTPDLTRVTSMVRMFALTKKINQDIGNWNVSNMTKMFRYAETFNQSLNNWNVARVTNMSRMFAYAFRFNSQSETRMSLPLRI